jgi:hypothetical protein
MDERAGNNHRVLFNPGDNLSGQFERAGSRDAVNQWRFALGDTGEKRSELPGERFALLDLLRSNSYLAIHVD